MLQINEFIFKTKYACSEPPSEFRTTTTTMLPTEGASALPPKERDWLMLSPGSIVLIA